MLQKLSAYQFELPLCTKSIIQVRLLKVISAHKKTKLYKKSLVKKMSLALGLNNI